MTTRWMIQYKESESRYFIGARHEEFEAKGIPLCDQYVRDESQAMKFQTSEAAACALDRLLARPNRGTPCGPGRFSVVMEGGVDQESPVHPCPGLLRAIVCKDGSLHYDKANAAIYRSAIHVELLRDSLDGTGSRKGMTPEPCGPHRIVLYYPVSAE